MEDDTNTTLLVGGAIVAAVAWLLTRAPTASALPGDAWGEFRDAYVDATTGDYAVAQPGGPTSVEDETGPFAPVREAEDEGGYDPTENQASDEHSYDEPTYDSPASDDAVEDVTRNEGETEQEFEDEFRSALPDDTPTPDGGTLGDDRDSSSSSSGDGPTPNESNPNIDEDAWGAIEF